jgi:hypothetical protein
MKGAIVPMIQKTVDAGPPLGEATIAAWEGSVGIVLPPAYKSFLLKHNGGRPIPRAFPMSDFPNNPYGTVQVFFRIGGMMEVSSIDWNVKTFAGRIPQELLPIACDGSGDLLLLALEGEHMGAVLFWDYYDQPVEPDYSNIYWVADSFDAFVESFCELPAFTE